MTNRRLVRAHSQTNVRVPRHGSGRVWRWAVALCSLVVLAITVPSEAATYTWDASGGTPLNDGGGNWNATGGTNWFDGTTYGAWGNASNDVAVFGVANGTAGTITVGTVNVGNITFNAAGSGNYTLSGGTIGLASAGVTGTIAVNSAGTTTISSAISGQGNLTKTGTSTSLLVLSGSNSVSGTTTVQTGTIRLGNNNALQNSTLNIVAGAGYSNAVIAVAGGTYSVGMIVGSGTLALGSNTLYSVGGSNLSGTFAGVMGAGAAINVALIKVGTGTWTISGIAWQSGGVTVNGGLLDLAGNANASSAGVLRGAVTVNEGATLRSSGSWSLGNAATLTANVQTLTLNSGTLDFGAASIGGLFGTGTMVTMTGGAITGKRFTLMSPTGSAAPTIRTLASSSRASITSGMTLSLGGTNSLVTTFDVARGTTADGIDFALENGINRESATVGGGILKTGSGTMLLSGAGDYQGTTTVRAGTLIAASNAPHNAAGAFGTAISAVVVGDASTAAGDLLGLCAGNGVTIGRNIDVTNVGAGTTLGGSGTSGIATYSGAITLNKAVTLQAATGGLVDFAGTWTTNNNRITIGSAGNAGTVRLSSVLSSTGAFALNAGTLDLNGLSQTVAAFSGSAGTTVTSASAATLTVGSAADSAFGGVFSGAVGLRKQGAGTLTLSGVSTNTGATIIESGTLVVGGANAISGSSAITIGSSGSRGFLEVDHPLSISSLTFDGQGGDISNLSTGTVTLSAASGTATITVLGGSNAFHANAALSSPTLVNVSSGAFFSFHNNLAGGASLTKSGAGTMELSGDNDTLSGNLFITGGRVNIGAGMNQIGTGTTTLSAGATIDLGGQAFTDRIVVLSGTILNAGGTATTTTIDGPTTISGTTTLLGTYNIASTGSARFESAVGNGSSIVNVNVNPNGGSGAQAVFANTVAAQANVTVYAGGMATFGNAVSGRVTSHGVSTFNGSFLSEADVQGGGAATFVGATGTASKITIASGGHAAFGNTIAGLVNVSGSATLTATSVLTGKLFTDSTGVATLDNVTAAITGELHNDGLLKVIRTSGSQTVSGFLHGSGSVVKQGSGTLVLTGSNSYSGGTWIEGGTLTAGHVNAFGTGLITLGSGATLDLANFLVTNAITNNGGTIRGGTISGTVSGATTLSGGQTMFDSTIAADAQIDVASSGTASFGNGATIQSGAMISNAGVIRVSRSSSDALSVGSVISGAGKFQIDSGKARLEAANDYTGNTVISGAGSVLALGTGGSFGNSQTIVVGDAGSSGAILDLTAKTGTFSFGSDQTLKGGGMIQLGENTTLDVQGTFAPGNSPGLFTYNGGTTLLSGTTIMEIWGPDRATLASHGIDPYYDAVNVVNGGILNFNNSMLTLDFNQSFGDNTAFDLFTAFGTGSSLVGNFGGVSVLGSYYTGLDWTKSKDGTKWTSSTTTSGQSLEFNAVTGTLVIVPEPDTIIFAGIGIAMAGWSLWKRRRIARILPRLNR